MVALEQLIISQFSVILFIYFLQKWRSGTIFPTRKNVPPSPRKLPVIGNLHQLGISPHRSFQSLSKRYGHLILLHFGRVPVLVVSSAEAAHEIMKTQDVIFSSRPKLSIPDRLLYGSTDVGFAPYGEYWRQMKSICVLHLLNNKRVQSFRRAREEETSAMVEKIKQMGCSLSVVNLSEILASLPKDVICRVVLGRKYNDYGEDKRLHKLLREHVNLLGATSFRDCIPWLGWIDHVKGLDAKVDRSAKNFDEFLENVIQEHRDGNKHDDGDGEFDFVDILLEFQRESQSRSLPVEDSAIKALVVDMFAAGTDTTFSTLDWAMAELIKNPRTMTVMQNEVRQVAGNKKEIDEDDLEKMTYLKAVIKETLRLHSPVPLLLPRESTQDTKLMGYDISAGTQVLINAWAIARDPVLWEQPEEFSPERFLDSSVDFRGLHFELIPFGAGRRRCPGITFAMVVIELGLAKLVHNFSFALPNGEREEHLDMSEAGELAVHKKHPLLVVTTPYIC